MVQKGISEGVRIFPSPDHVLRWKVHAVGGAGVQPNFRSTPEKGRTSVEGSGHSWADTPEALIEGPSDSPFAGGVFSLSVGRLSASCHRPPWGSVCFAVYRTRDPWA